MMAHSYRKKLIEVALPLEAINKESAREKSIRHGHPSTLHLWWARRPLAACRAVLFASLVDDPDDDLAYEKYAGETREHFTAAKRQDLFDLISELVKWENSNDEAIIRSARAEIARCVAQRKIETGELKRDLKLAGGATVGDLATQGHCKPTRSGATVTGFDTSSLPAAESVNAFLAEHAPPVLDPFCGGGSIPLEAQRLGLRAYASDLNPVPVLITKALIEIPPKFANKPPVNPEARKQGTTQNMWKGAQGLAEDVRYYGKWMRDEAEKRIGHLYPKVKVTAEMAKERSDLKPYVGEELTAIAWLWTRTVASPNPAAGGAHVPLLRSFWLSTKKGKEAWVEPIVNRASNTYEFKVRHGKPTDEFDPSVGTVNRKGGRCLLTESPMPFPHIRSEAKAGRMRSRLFALVAEAGRNRLYLSPTPEHHRAADVEEPEWRPEGEMPLKHRNFQPPVYGMTRLGDLFTSRQLVALNCLAGLVEEARKHVSQEIEPAETAGGGIHLKYDEAVATYLGEAVSKTTSFHCSLATWRINDNKSARAFGRQAVPMVWDFAEVNPFVDAGGSWKELFESAEKTIWNLPAAPEGMVDQRDATTPYGHGPLVISTDPPYYDNVAYADLSDFYYAWLRRSLARYYPKLFSTMVTPKSTELVAAPHRHDGDRDAAARFFESGLGTAFGRMREAAHPSAPVTIYYAFKQAEDNGEDEDDSGGAGVASTGWETMLEGLIRAGFSVLGTWPMRTESTVGLKTVFNSLASSIVLVCRSRSSSAPIRTRREFLNALKEELPNALKNLQRGSIAPVDLAQAAIGPGMAVFTRYAKVMEADGSAMRVRQALALINQTLDEVLAEQEGEFDADTRWALAWFEQHSMDDGAFGVADVLARAKNTAVNALVEAGLVKARGGKVRLLKRDELPDNWDPAADTRLRHWEIVQHLIHALETGGETAAADLLRRVGGMGEVARDLAYRLYNICERKGWAQEALAYNGLVIAWPEISKLAQAAPATRTVQAGLYDEGR